MDIQVNRHQLERIVIKWLNKYFGNLTPKTSSTYPRSVFYINSGNEIMMEYDNETERVYIHNDYIWLKIKLLFHLEYNDIQLIMKVWVEGAYKLGGVTPFNGRSYFYSRWKEITNWGE